MQKTEEILMHGGHDWTVVWLYQTVRLTQLVERRQIQRAVPVTPCAIQHRVSALAVWSFCETVPRAIVMSTKTDFSTTISPILSLHVCSPANHFGMRCSPVTSPVADVKTVSTSLTGNVVLKNSVIFDISKFVFNCFQREREWPLWCYHNVCSLLIK